MTTAELVETYADLPLDERLRRIEAEMIAAALAETHGNKSKAAIRLGIKRSTLGDRIGRCADILVAQSDSQQKVAVGP